MNVKDKTTATRIAAGGVALMAILGTSLIVNKLGNVNPAKPDAPENVVREGFLYAGIPARIEFQPVSVADYKAADGQKTAFSQTAFDAEIMNGTWARLADVSSTFNAYDPTSELGKLNTNPSIEPVPVSDDLAKVTAISGLIGQLTHGAFDITIRPLKSIWKMAAKTGQLPDTAARASALERTGFGKLDMRQYTNSQWNITRKVPGMELDFGGIVKGWSVGRGLDYLTTAGVKSALVQVGGEIAISGQAPGGGPWRVGIKHPLKKDANWTVLSISGRAAVSTSGNYEQPVKIGNTDYYHIINPSTGEPISSDILGVTVVVTRGPDMNAMADGLSTGFAVLGADKSIEQAEHMPGVDVMFIVRGADGKPIEKTTSGFAKLKPPL